MANNHYVSRFLTRKWETEDRALYYYDFDTQTVGKRPSRILFARRGLNDPEVEKRLNTIIENPLASSLPRLLSPGQDFEIPIADWKLFRALALLLPTQTSRIVALSGREPAIEELILRPETDLDGMAKAFDSLFVMCRANVLDVRYPLAYPSHGFFAIPCPRILGGYDVAFGIPVTPRCAFVAVPRTSNPRASLEWWSSNESKLLCKASIGLRASTVVVHQNLFARSPDGGKRLGAALEEMRDELRILFKLCIMCNEV